MPPSKKTPKGEGARRAAVNKVAGKIPAPAGFSKTFGKVNKAMEKATRGRKR